MECDLHRLSLAIEARAKADGRDWRSRMRIAGFKNIQEPVEMPRTNTGFNDQIRLALQVTSKPSKTS